MKLKKSIALFSVMVFLAFAVTACGISGTAPIGKLLYLYEGRTEKAGRRELTHVFYLGGLYAGSVENHRLFRRMQKYIETNYETKYLKQVYISGDCGAWIKAGVSDIDKGVMVMDKYHLMKYINKAANQMLDDTSEVKGRLWKALYKSKKKKFVMVENRNWKWYNQIHKSGVDEMVNAYYSIGTGGN